MKKSIYKILRAAGLGLAAVAMAGLTACTSEDNMTEQPTPQAAPVYQVSIPAGFGDETSGTRAVSLNATGGLDATFKTTDNFRVQNKTKHCSAMNANKELIFLHPDADGATAKLEGNLTFWTTQGYKTVDVNDVLLLANTAYTTNYFYYEPFTQVSSPTRGKYQSGTLAGLNLFDYASCEVPITGISGAGTADDPYTLTTGKASFVNAQSMYKFIFTGLPEGVGVEKVTIHSNQKKLVSQYSVTSDNNTKGDVNISFSSPIDDGYSSSDRHNERRNANNTGANEGENIVYAALRFDALNAGETDDITFTVEGTDGRPYGATKTSPVGGFQNGKYYTSTIALTLIPLDISNIDNNYTVKDGMTLTGTLNSNKMVSIAKGATVTLDGVTINGTGSDPYVYAGITCEGDATIILNGTNTVKGFNKDYPGIHVPAGKKLIIKGTGSLNATGGQIGAGIGGGTQIACGDIEIQGGIITAVGGQNAAGIGSGRKSTCGNITISGGTVNATGGQAGAGIGSAQLGACGAITISGGSVNATGGEDGAGIGSGRNGSCGDITITSGVTHVTATKGASTIEGTVTNSIGKGSGTNATCGTIKFGSATVYSGGNVGNQGVWSPATMVDGNYGGLTLKITTTTNANDTWTLTPTSSN